MGAIMRLGSQPGAAVGGARQVRGADSGVPGLVGRGYAGWGRDALTPPANNCEIEKSYPVMGGSDISFLRPLRGQRGWPGGHAAHDDHRRPDGTGLALNAPAVRAGRQGQGAEAKNGRYRRPRTGAVDG